MAKSKFFRIAVEGATVDGRTIERSWLEEMAASYDAATYTARINCEHIAGYSPERPFNAYGSVLSLKTEEVKLSINGAEQTRLGLYAEIDANDQLVEINKAGQKLFTSCEIHPNFAGEGKAYLVGLAVTDMPASLGTEPLKFAAMHRPNLFTAAAEIEALEFAAAQADAASIGEQIGRGIMAFFRKDAKPDAPVTPPNTGTSQTPPAAANDNLADPQAFATAIGAAMGQQIAAAVKPATDAVTALETRFTALEQQLQSTEQQQTFKRTPATGGANAVVTDC